MSHRLISNSLENSCSALARAVQVGVVYRSDIFMRSGEPWLIDNSFVMNDPCEVLAGHPFRLSLGPQHCAVCFEVDANQEQVGQLAGNGIDK